MRDLALQFFGNSALPEIKIRLMSPKQKSKWEIMMNPATEVARRALAALATDEPYTQRLSEARSRLKLLSSPNRVALDPKIVEIVDKVFDDRFTAKDHEAALVSAIETVLRLG